MNTRLEKILNPWVLLSLNLVIMISTELSGSFFQETGIIHLIAIFFVILAISRIFVHYDAYDQYLRLLIIGGSVALVILSLSHIVEFLGYVVFKSYSDAIFINVVNFYVMSMLVVTVGAEYFLHALKRNPITTIVSLITGISVFLFLTLSIFLKKISVSLKPDEIIIYVYGAIVLFTLFFSINYLLKIKKDVSIMSGFVDYFIASFVLIAISALQYVFYDVLQNTGISMLQIIYMSHFLFYGALSFMFLAFARLTNLGGLYNDAEKYKENIHSGPIVS